MSEAVLRRLRRRIAVAGGAVSVADYMAEALAHPEHGYYRRGDPLGRDGDFVTAPEISQVFGELIGLWCVDAWRAMGAPDPVRLVELGPGRGTLMADALRAARVAPGFLGAARLHLVETSRPLREAQRSALGAAGAAPVWHDDFAEVPAGPMLLVANEFFDALPVHQYLRVDGAWRERLVTVDAGGALAFCVDRRPTPIAALLPASPAVTAAELSPATLALASAIGARLAAAGGAALVIDYGPAGDRPGGTLQAVRRHRPVPVLEHPGEADLTAHVDFGLLARAAAEAGAAVWGPVAQGEFLMRLGLAERAAMLCRTAAPDTAAAIRAGCRRLIDPAEMGTLFKVVALTGPGQPPPAGFEGA